MDKIRILYIKEDDIIIVKNDEIVGRQDGFSKIIENLSDILNIDMKFERYGIDYIVRNGVIKFNN